MFFGGLLKFAQNDAVSTQILKDFWQSIELETNPYVGLWKSGTPPNLDDEAKRFILRVTSLDPRKRVRMSEVVADLYLN
jgi:hypothetical protein